MSHKIHAILFLIFTIFFVTVAPIAIFYSQGWRFDFDHNQFIQTGGLFLKTKPQARVYINHQLKAKTAPWNKSTFIKNLLPKKYTVEVKQEGFHSWKKKLEIREGEVTEAENIVLFPKQSNLKFIDRAIKGFFVSSRGDKIIFEKEKDKKKQLLIYNPEQKTIRKLSELGLESEIINLEWGLNSERVLIKTELKEKREYSILNLNTTQLTKLNFSIWSTSSAKVSSNTKVSFNPQDPDKILVNKTTQGSSQLVEVNLSTNSTKVILTNFVAYKILKRGIVWLSPKGLVFKSNLSGAIETILNSAEPITINQELDYQLFSKGKRLLIKEGKDLYFFNQQSEKFEKVFKDPQQIKYAPDHRKALIAGDYEIWVLYLEQQYSQPHKEWGQKVFLTRLSKEIDQVFWLNSNYLIFKVEDKVKVTEIDDRDQINIVDLEKTAKKIYWNKNNKKLYLLKDNKLYSSPKLIP